MSTSTPAELLTLDEINQRYVRQVLAAVGCNMTRAAKILGIDRRTLYRKLKQYRADTGGEGEFLRTG